MKKLSYIDYCALPRLQQIWYKIYSGFFSVIFGIGNFFKGIGIGFVNLLVKIKNSFVNVGQSFKYGDIFTKLSFVFLGLSHIKRKQYVKGAIIFLTEIAFIYFMFVFGANAINNLITLGSGAVKGYYCKNTPDIVFPDRDTFYQAQIDGQDGTSCLVPTEVSLPDSALYLLFGAIAVIVIIAFVMFYLSIINTSYKIQVHAEEGKKLSTFKEDISTFLNSKFHITLLFLPIVGVVIFTIFPLLDMILMAFTSYDIDHQWPASTFGWVGLDNFTSLFQFGGSFGYTFFELFKWTVVWAILATFLNFILGVLVATIINKKGVKLKKLWRTCLVLSVAVPQFVSLLSMSQFLGEFGPLTEIVEMITGKKVLFLGDYNLARACIVIVNIWIGIPYTVLSTTGILMNIPADLYESAKIDGASSVTMYFKITLRYVIFVMGPSLITTFIGNFNNFGVIYLLTGGGPKTSNYYQSTAGYTDLLVTWLYTLTTGANPRYNLASVIGIIIFIISATLSLIVYRNSSSFKNEEDFA